MVGCQTDGRPAVRVDLVGQRPQQHLLVAVGLVEVALAELLDDHALLRFELLGGDVEPLHAVALEPERRLDVVLRQRDVEVRVVVVREGVVVAGGHLDRKVEVGDAARAAEHQVFEQMGESRPVGALVAGADPVEDVHRGEFRGAVAVHHDRQSVGKTFGTVWNHGANIRKEGRSGKPPGRFSGPERFGRPFGRPAVRCCKNRSAGGRGSR